MISNHIRNEALRRLPSATEINDELLKTLNIDDTAHPIEPDEHPELFASGLSALQGESAPIRGHVPFELTLGVMGETMQVDCRASYVVTLYDGEDRFTGEPVRALGSIGMRYEVLDWRDPDNCDEETGEPHRLPIPRWVKADLSSLLSRTVEHKLDDLIEEQAITQERQARAFDDQSES